MPGLIVARLAALMILWHLLPTMPARAETPLLPGADQIFTIAVRPQVRQLTEFFTPERLLASLPLFKPAYTLKPIGGKIWSQSGVIVLKDGQVLFWKSYRDDLIAVETGGEPRVYIIDR